MPSFPPVEKVTDKDEIFTGSSLGGPLFGKATDVDVLVSSLLPKEGLSNHDDELDSLLLCGLPDDTNELDLGSEKKQVLFLIKVKVRVCQFLQVVETTAMISIVLRHFCSLQSPTRQTTT